MAQPASQPPVDPQEPDRPAVDAQPVDSQPVDPHQSDPKPRSLVARIRLFFFRTTLGRTRKDKNEV
jgi:hypothetical protein